ncbi:MAG: twin-arginine translocation signal domain-containing protein [Terracidiphilus sp.]
MSKINKPKSEDGFSRRDFLQSGSAATLMTALGTVPLAGQPATSSASAASEGENASKDSGSDAGFPRVWLSSPERGLTADSFEDVASHGVQVIETTDIQGARKHGLQVMLASDVDGMFMGEIIGPRGVTQRGLTPEYAVAIGGTYKDLSIDSHTFPFMKGKHSVEIGLPWHYAPYDWKAKKYFTDNRTFDSHFDEGIFSTDRAFKAEIVVKRQAYDGRQHLAIIPAVISGRSSLSLNLTFDLTNVDGDLEHTILAVYWRTNQLSPAAASTQETAARSVRAVLDGFTRKNGGVFPDDVIRAMRFGDECFLRTGFVNSPKCAIPLYDYSDSGIAGYRKLNGNDEYPRAWGFPEFFGVNAYRDWLYAFHTSTAELVKSVVTEAHKVSPRLMVFRNTTRFNPTPFATLANDHDGCSAQLLAQQFDMLNPDPYPVARTGDSQSTNSDRDPQAHYIESMIPLENAYWSGLVRRLGKKVVPWMQAHTFSFDLQHPMPNDVSHMYEQVVGYNPDGIMWLGYDPGATAESTPYGMTLPNVRPETWKALRCINDRAHHDLGRPKKVPGVAVLRFYAERSLVDLERRHLHDRFLTEQILTGLTMDLDIPYDVFEYYKREDVDCRMLRGYRSVIMCVTDLEGLPLDELKRQGIPLSIVCWNASSLTTHPEFTGVTDLRQLPGKAIGVTEPSGPGIIVPENYSGITEWDSNLVVTGPAGVTMPAGLAYGATLRPAATSIAKAGDKCCVWRHRNAVFSSFLPKDAFDEGEYVRWLMNGDTTT